MIISLFSLLNCSTDNDSDVITTINAIVYHKYVPVKLPLNDHETNALKIKESNSSEWYTVTHIEGFNYEENFEYNLRLRKTILANPPEDASSVNYELIKIISKEPK